MSELSAATQRESELRLYQAEMLLIGVMLVWALNFPVTKWAIGDATREGMNIFAFNAIRYIFAGASIVVVFFLQRRAWQKVGAGDWKRLLGLGLLAHVFYQMAFIIGLSKTTAGNSAIIVSTSPLWTVLFTALLHKERIRGATLGAMGLSLTGIAMIVVGSGKKIEFGSEAVTGDLITLAAAMLWALNTSIQKPLVARYPSTQVALVSVGVGALVLPLVGVPAMATMDWGAFTVWHYVAAILSGALSIGLANVVWSHAVKKIGPAQTANFNNLVPVIAFAVSYFFLEEQYKWLQIIGAAITICGVWLARRTAGNSAPPVKTSLPNA
jgi:drug/metabolite transporter (DMT)-like permease